MKYLLILKKTKDLKIIFKRNKMNNNKNVCDIPLLSEENDELEIGKYTEGLIDFIKHCSTPMTISIQGEWGSGKTSLINKLNQKLEKHFDTNIINTWDYSLIDQDELPIVIFKDFISKINGKIEKKSKASEIVGSFFKVGASVLVSKVSEGGLDISSEIDKYIELPSLTSLKKQIKELIEERCLSTKKNMIFFVDDLDRLNPIDAIKILELLKNLFDQPHCIFILAIDYDVVVKGLKVKFGNDKNNEREYRQFFDKIVQLPFTMPVANYDLKKYLKKLLVDQIGYLNENEFQNNESILEDVTINSIGKNPRALKRVINYLSLIKCIINVLGDSDEKKREDKVVQYILLCIQIAYPQIYSYLTRYPNFIDQWNDKSFTVEMSKLKEDKFIFNEDDELFDDPWEKTLYLYVMSLENKYLVDRLRNISSIFNILIKYIEIERNNENFDTLMYDMIKMSSITDAQNSMIGSGDKQEYTIFWENLNKGIPENFGKFNENRGPSSRFKFSNDKKTFKNISVIFKGDNIFSLSLKYNGQKITSNQWKEFYKNVNILDNDSVEFNEKTKVLKIASIRQESLLNFLHDINDI